MSHSSGWVPDPYGVHEFRFFSADGKATLLVMDGGKRSYDKPPTTVPAPLSQPLATSETQPAPPQGSEEASPSGGPPSPLDSEPTAPDANKTAVRIPMPQSDIKVESAASQSAAAGAPPRAADPRSFQFADDRQTPTVAHRNPPEPMSRALRISYGVVFGVLAISALGLAYVHLRHHGGSPTKSAERTTTTSSVRNTTTTTSLPTAPRPGAEAAATALISSWATQNRAAALTVATPAAVTTLFAVPYTDGLAEDRGCSTSFTPIVCTFGPPGGASPSDPIYQVSVSQSPGGWYVSSVKLENVGSGGTSPTG
jgi:hypothetical protein